MIRRATAFLAAGAVWLAATWPAEAGDAWQQLHPWPAAESLGSVVEGNAERIQVLFDEIANEDPARAVELWLRMASFVIPKPSPLTPEQTEDTVVDSIEITIREDNFEKKVNK